MDQIDLAFKEYSKFEDQTFRAFQKEAVAYAYENEKRVTIVTAPTGSGKSILGMTLGNLFPKFLYLVSSKHLQDQLFEDFPEAEMIKGRSNYACLELASGATAEECNHSKQSPCKSSDECPYKVQKNITLESRRQILNYMYFITESNFIGRFSEYPMIIADEGDALEDILINLISIKFSTGTFRQFGIPKPKYKTFESDNAVNSWRSWAGESINILNEQISDYKYDLEHAGNDKEEIAKLLKTLHRLSEMQGKLVIFRKFVDNTWLLETTRHNEYSASYEVKPTWLTKALTEQYFFRHGERFLLMSATFPHKDVFTEMMGLPAGDVCSMEIPSTFPVSNRQVMLMNSADLKMKNGCVDPSEILKTQNIIAELLHKHRGEKGIIHTVNWKLNEAIMNIGDSRLITHGPGDKIEQLNKFINSTEARVFVSPSSTRGINLPDDKSRFNIIAKCPFKNLGDKMVAARVFNKSHRGQYWYQCVTKLARVVTPTGIKHIKDIVVGDRVLSYNPLSNISEFKKVLNTVQYNFDGELHKIRSKRFSLTTTANHEIYYKTSNPYKPERTKQTPLNKKMIKDIHITPSTCVLKPFQILNEGRKTTKTINLSKFSIKPFTYKSGMNHRINKLNTASHSNAGVIYNMNDYLELAGWYISEGYTAKNRVTIYQSKDKNPHKYYMIQSLLTRMKINHKCKPDLIHFSHQEIAESFRYFFGTNSFNKKIPSRFLALPQDQLLFIFGSLMMGDGSIKKHGFTYTTVSKQLANDVLFIALMLGYSVNLNLHDHFYNVLISKPSQHTRNIKHSTFHLNTTVYDIEVEDNHNYYCSDVGNFILISNSICAQEIVQACGRSVRHKDDWCTSYVLDRQACNLITDRQQLFPRYFIEAVEVG